MDLPLAPGYTVGAADAGMIERILDLITAADIAEFGESTGYSADEIRDGFAILDPEKDTWIVTGPTGELVGFALIQEHLHERMDAEGFIHPEHMNRGIGTTLVRLGERRAREHVPLAAPGTRVVLHNWVNANNAAACSLMEREGYTAFRYFYRMEAALAEEPAAPEWPDNIEVRSLIVGKDEHRFYSMFQEAMADHWGFLPMDFETWKERQFGSTFEPSLWFLATENGEPVGGSACSIADGVGWVNDLAVRRPWRRRGVAMALLRHSAGEFHRRGLAKYALGVDVDSPTGATRLYERAGMHVAQRHAAYGKVLREGVDVTDEGIH